MMRRHASCSRGDRPFRACMRQIAEAQNTDHTLVLVEDWQPANLFGLLFDSNLIPRARHSALDQSSWIAMNTDLGFWTVSLGLATE
jgi:hypothetical protein